MLLVRSQWLCLNKILFKEASLNKWMLDSWMMNANQWHILMQY
jgi:hypothetical protein